MTIKELMEKFKLKGKKTAAIVGMSAALASTAVGCGKEVEVDNSTKTESVDDTKEVETPVVVTPEVSENVVETPVVEAPVADKEIVVEEVTMDMLNERLAELVTKYEGTYTEDELKFMLASANASFMSSDVLVEFTGCESVEGFFGDSSYLLNLKNLNDENIKNYVNSGSIDKMLLNPGDVLFGDDLVEMGNWIFSETSAVFGTDKDKSISASRALIKYYTGESIPGVTVDEAPISISNAIFNESVSMYVNWFFVDSIEAQTYEEALTGFEKNKEQIYAMINVYENSNFSSFEQETSMSK